MLLQRPKKGACGTVCVHAECCICGFLCGADVGCCFRPSPAPSAWARHGKKALAATAAIAVGAAIGYGLRAWLSKA